MYTTKSGMTEMKINARIILWCICYIFVNNRGLFNKKHYYTKEHNFQTYCKAQIETCCFETEKYYV